MSTAGDLRATAHELQALPGQALELVARAATTAAEVEARRSGPTFAGRRLSADATVRSGAGAAAARVAPVPPGPWAILESGAGRHVIGARGRVLAGAMRHPVTVPVAHPGVPGRRSWSRVHEAVEAAAGEAIADELGRVIGRG